MLITEAAVGRLALLAPGGSNDVNIPVLRFARETAGNRGASVHALRWEIDSEELRRQMTSVPLGRIPVSVAQMVHDQAAAALAQLATSGGLRLYSANHSDRLLLTSWPTTDLPRCGLRRY